MFETEGLSRTLAERVAATLAEQIAAGELKPGERLIEGLRQMMPGARIESVLIGSPDGA